MQHIQTRFGQEYNAKALCNLFLLFGSARSISISMVRKNRAAEWLCILATITNASFTNGFLRNTFTKDCGGTREVLESQCFGLHHVSQRVLVLRITHGWMEWRQSIETALMLSRRTKRAQKPDVAIVCDMVIKMVMTTKVVLINW